MNPNIMTASVPSSGGGGRTYGITQAADGSWACACPAWRNQRKPPSSRSCKHMVQLVQELGRHIVAAAEVPEDPPS